MKFLKISGNIGRFKKGTNTLRVAMILNLREKPLFLQWIYDELATVCTPVGCALRTSLGKPQSGITGANSDCDRDPSTIVKSLMESSGVSQ